MLNGKQKMIFAQRHEKIKVARENRLKQRNLLV
jgi:hypothetical protein